MKKLILFFLLCSNSLLFSQEYGVLIEITNLDNDDTFTRFEIDIAGNYFEYSKLDNENIFRKWLFGYVPDAASATGNIPVDVVIYSTARGDSGPGDCDLFPTGTSFSTQDPAGSFRETTSCDYDFTFTLIHIDSPPIGTDLSSCRNISFTPYNGLGTILNWQWSTDGDANDSSVWNDFYSPSNESLSGLGVPPSATQVWFRIGYEGIFLTPSQYTINPCAPEFDYINPINNASCFGSSDGSVTLNFTEDVSDPDNQMRLFVFSGMPPPDLDISNLVKDEDPNDIGFPNLPIRSPRINMQQSGANYTVTLDGLQGSNGVQTSTNYYIIYQEVNYDVSPVYISAFGPNPVLFEIQGPTEIVINSLSIKQPTCSDNRGEVTVIAEGGGFEPNPNGPLEYIILRDGTEIASQTTPTFSNLAAGDYTFIVQTSDSCSKVSEEINIVIPSALSFLNPVPGTTSGADGVIRVEYAGGTPGQTPNPNYTFKLFRADNAASAFEEILNPNLINSTINTSVEFRDLSEGLYRVEITDGNGCTETTESIGDIEVSETPTPQLTNLMVTPVSCGNTDDATISVTADYPTATSFFYELREGATVVKSNSPAGQTSSMISISDVEPGTYTLFVRASVGDFSSVPIPEITNPNPIIISVSNIQSLDCNGTPNGFIEIDVSETGDFQYAYRNLGSWIDLPTNGRIPISQTGTYDDLLIRKTTSTSCISNEIDNIFVPEGLSLTETISNVTVNDGNDGSINIVVSGGTPSNVPNEYTYVWTGTPLVGTFTTQTTQNIQNLTAGSYSVLVADASSCEKIFGPFTVTEPGPLSLQATTGTPTCNGLSTGSVTVEAQGTGDVRFDFFEGSPTNIVFTSTTSERTVTALNLPAGDYGVTITEIDSGDERTTDTADYFTINELAAITATVTPTNATCASPNSGEIMITGATGGSNTGFTYGLDDGFLPQNTGTFTGLSARDYIVTITDDLGCEYKETVTIGAGELPIIDSTTSGPTSPTTVGGNDGFITLNFENTDISGFTYEWNGPGTTNVSTQNLTNIEAGSYSVLITGGPGCSITENFTVDPPAPQDITSNVTNVDCKGDASGAINATIIGEVPVSYQWTFADDSVIMTGSGTTSEDISGLLAGTYVLTITYADTSTFRSGNINITEPLNDITADITTTPSCAANNTGTIVISNVQGGEPGNPQDYTYSIDGLTFQDPPLFENLAAATYSVWIRDGNGCDLIRSGISIDPSPEIVWDELNIIVTNATAQGTSDGAIGLAFTSDATNYTYQWNGPGTVSEATQNLAGKAAGVYTVNVTNENGCSIERIFTIAEPGLLEITVTGSKNPCFGENNGSIQTTVNGTGNLSLQWSEAVLGDLLGENGPNLNNAPQGTYTLRVTDDAISPPNVVSSTPIALSDPAAILEAQAIPSDAQCAGVADGFVTIAANGGIPPYEYSIDAGVTYQAQATFNNLGLGTYSIRVRDSNDCIADDGFTINEPPTITFNSAATPLSAAGSADGAIDIAAGGGTGNLSFSWVGPPGFTPTTDEDISDLIAGDYTVTVTDENGCTFISNPIIIDEPGAIIITLTINEEILCNGDEFGEIIADVQGGVPDFTYQWFQEGNNTPLAETTNLISNLGAGNYFLRVTDANGIVRDSDTIPLTQPSDLEVTLQNQVDIVCSGDASGSININVLGGTLPYTFQWSNGGTSQNLANIEAGDYFVEVFDDNGCSDLLEITINPAPDALQLEATVTDASEYLVNDGAIALGISGGAAPYTINWTKDSDNTPAGNTATLTALAADSYTVSVSDANDCNTTETYEVTQPDIVEDTIVQPSCQGDTNGSISVLVNQGNGSFTYLWSTGQTTNTISNLGAGNYSVTITGFGDGPLTRNYTLEDPAPLEVDLGPNRVLCANQILELDATVPDETATYTWTSDNGFSSSTPNVTLTTSGNYTVTVQTASGCTAVGSLSLEVSTDEIDAEFAVSSQVFTGEVLVAVDISFPLPEVIEWQVPEGATVVKQDSDEVELIFDQAGEYEITIVTKRGECITQKTKKVVVVAKDGSVNENDDPRKLVEDFIIYPNPTMGRFTADVSLTESGNISIKVFNFSNNVMMASERGRGETSYSIPFDISGMPSGVYAVLLETPYGTSLRKIVVR